MAHSSGAHSGGTTLPRAAEQDIEDRPTVSLTSGARHPTVDMSAASTGGEVRLTPQTSASASLAALAAPADSSARERHGGLFVLVAAPFALAAVAVALYASGLLGRDPDTADQSLPPPEVAGEAEGTSPTALPSVEDVEPDVELPLPSQRPDLAPAADVVPPAAAEPEPPLPLVEAPLVTTNEDPSSSPGKKSPPKPAKPGPAPPAPANTPESPPKSNPQPPPAPVDPPPDDKPPESKDAPIGEGKAESGADENDGRDGKAKAKKGKGKGKGKD
jgi:hypothetical protein